jgi:dolichol-phosphate mannosyltransferase
LGHALVIVPTYNERENIASLLDKVFSIEQPCHVLIVDDGSPDGTALLVKELQLKYSGRLHLLERAGKLGLGTAYLAGFQWGLDKGYAYIFEMDADFSHNPDDLPRLLHACEKEGADLAIGSRYVKGGGVINWPFNRIALSKGASYYTRLITGMPVKDPTAGFMCYSRKVLEGLDLKKIRFVGYAFQIEMKFKAWRAGFRIKEVPIQFQDRTLGVSKMHRGIIEEGIWGVLKLRWHACFGD